MLHWRGHPEAHRRGAVAVARRHSASSSLSRPRLRLVLEMRRVSVIFVSLKNLSFQKEKAEEEPLVSTEEPSEGAATSAAAKSSEDKVFALATPRVLSSARGLDADVPAVPAPDPPAADAAAPPDAPSPAAVAAEEHHVQEIVPDYRELNEVMRIVQKVIFRHDGFVRQFLVDDKGRPHLVLILSLVLIWSLGCTLIAVFGVPTTHPDDPIRAMAAALSIKNQLKGLGLKSYIGVTCVPSCRSVVAPSDLLLCLARARRSAARWGRVTARSTRSWATLSTSARASWSLPTRASMAFSATPPLSTRPHCHFITWGA